MNGKLINRKLINRKLINRTRIAMAFGLGLACVLAACGGQDEAQKAGEAGKATEVVVESAPQAGASTGEETEATVESAQGGAQPTDE